MNVTAPTDSRLTALAVAAQQFWDEPELTLDNPSFALELIDVLEFAAQQFTLGQQSINPLTFDDVRNIQREQREADAQIADELIAKWRGLEQQAATMRRVYAPARLRRRLVAAIRHGTGEK